MTLEEKELEEASIRERSVREAAVDKAIEFMAGRTSGSLKDQVTTFEDLYTKIYYFTSNKTK